MFPDAPAIFPDAPTLAPSRSKSFQISSAVAVYSSFLIQVQASSRQNVDENARKSKYSTRSKDLKRPRTGDLFGAKNPAKCRNVKHCKEEDNEEVDETLGGFISHTSQIITRIEGGRWKKTTEMKMVFEF